MHSGSKESPIITSGQDPKLNTDQKSGTFQRTEGKGTSPALATKMDKVSKGSDAPNVTNRVTFRNGVRFNMTSFGLEPQESQSTMRHQSAKGVLERTVTR